MKPMKVGIFHDIPIKCLCLCAFWVPKMTADHAYAMSEACNPRRTGPVKRVRYYGPEHAGQRHLVHGLGDAGCTLDSLAQA